MKSLDSAAELQRRIGRDGAARTGWTGPLAARRCSPTPPLQSRAAHRACSGVMRLALVGLALGFGGGRSLAAPANCGWQAPVNGGASARLVQESSRQPTAGGTTASVNDFDGERAYDVLKQVVALGPRISGSKPMKEQQELLTKHFEGLGATVFPHKFKYAAPSKPTKQVQLTNLIVSWNPSAPRRILLCTHYDTRPYADQDRRNKRAKLPGANDGGSGVALLHELGRHMPELKSGSLGVDFVFFDAEEYVFNNRQEAGEEADPLFVGSTQFANDYKTGVTSGSLGYVYEAGVLLDMIGDAELELYWEKNSMSYPVARDLAREIWAVAQTLGYPEFHPEIRHDVRDDHLPLNVVANIPTIDLIDFDYPTIARSNEYWHTTEDTPEKCSAESLDKVGTVLLEWLKKRVQP